MRLTGTEKMPCSVCKKAGHNKNTCSTKASSLAEPSPAEPSPAEPSPAEPSPEVSSSRVVDTPDIALVRALATEILDALGAGHTESVYHNAMKVGLQDSNLKFETERDIIIKFRGRYVGTVRADLIVESRLVIELKASFGADVAVSDALEQCRIYMKETATPSGIVVVFPKRVGGKLIISVA